MEKCFNEEIGKDFDDLVEQVGEQVAVFAMLEWYNSWVKENTIAIEGLNHLQEHRLIENIEQSIKEDKKVAGYPNIAKKVGSAYNKATAAVGKGAQAVVGGAMNVLIKPVLNSAPVKGFLNKVQQAVGMQGAIDPTKLQADYEGAGSPTDSDEVGKFLIKNAGATKSEVDAAFKGAGVEAQAPEETPMTNPPPRRWRYLQKDRGGETSQKVVKNQTGTQPNRDNPIRRTTPRWCYRRCYWRTTTQGGATGGATGRCYKVVLQVGATGGDRRTTKRWCYRWTTTRRNRKSKYKR